jgi:hypothetical protein
MTLTMNAGGNGKVRKSLASQLDRLDAMLDGLGEAIPQVVAETIRAVAGPMVQEAVQAALKELLSNPAILEKLRIATAPVAPAPTAQLKVTVRERLARAWRRVRAGVGRGYAACRSGLCRFGSAAADLWHRAVQRIATACAPLSVLRHVGHYFLIALAIGIAVSAAAWFSGPAVASALSGVGGFGSTVAVQIGMWFRRMLPNTDRFVA